jgi:hypothetical protein
MAGSLYHPTGLGMVKLTDSGNPVTTNTNISFIPRAAGAIYDATTAENNIKHVIVLLP